MEGKVVTIEGFKAVGLTYFGDNQKGEIPALWGAFNKQFANIANKSLPMLCYGICDDMPDESGCFHYTAAAKVNDFSDVPEGMDTHTIPSGKYVIYTFSGPLTGLETFYCDIFGKWIPEASHVLDGRPQLELYDERYMQNGEFDIYIPIM
jgi:AraC family transcriptional regulator